MKVVVLGGEGNHELGPARGDGTRGQGCLESLLRKIAPTGWRPIKWVEWKSIRKFRPGAHRQAEERNVRGLALMAREVDADIVVFSRDRDRDHDRERCIERALAELQAESVESLRLAGGVCVENLEGWLAALEGRRGSEKLPDEEHRRLHRIQVEERVRTIEAAQLAAIPEDARSLRRWLERATRALSGDLR